MVSNHTDILLAIFYFNIFVFSIWRKLHRLVHACMTVVCKTLHLHPQYRVNKTLNSFCCHLHISTFIIEERDSEKVSQQLWRDCSCYDNCSELLFKNALSVAQFERPLLELQSGLIWGSPTASRIDNLERLELSIAFVNSLPHHYLHQLR